MAAATTTFDVKKPPSDAPLRAQVRQALQGPEQVLDDVYPLPFTRKERTKGFYIALFPIALIFCSIPLSFVYVAWYLCLAERPALPQNAFRSLFRLYPFLEVASVFYQLYLAWTIQKACEPSDLTLNQWSTSLQRILQSGMGGVYHPTQDNAGNSTAHSIRSNSPTALKDRKPAALKKVQAEVESENSGFQTPTPGTASPDVKLGKMKRDDPRAIEFRERLRNWFGRVPFDQLTRIDALNWLSWASCCLPFEVANQIPDRRALIEKGYEMLEARTGWEFPEEIPLEHDQTGQKQQKVKRAAVKLMRLTLDPVIVIPRPLWLYCLIWLAHRLIHDFLFTSWGLTAHRQGDLEYLVRIPKGWKPDHMHAKADPIVFIHGLGFGSDSFVNMSVIKKLCKTLGSHPLLIPLQPAISQHFFHKRHLRPYARKEFVRDVAAACERWGFFSDQGISQVAPDNKTDRHELEPRREHHLCGRRDKGGVVLLSHSNGSVGHAWLLKDKPEITKRNAFVDPIVFSCWEGDVCYNFCYRTPTTALQVLLKAVIATELGIANAIQRHFDWSANTLFPEEIPDAADHEKTLYVLGGTDIIVDAPRTKIYLERHGVRKGIQFDPHKGHSDGLRGSSLDRLLIWLETGKSIDVAVQSD